MIIISISPQIIFAVIFSISFFLTNKRLLLMHQAGLLERARHNSRRISNKNPCSISETKKVKKNEAKELTLVDLSGAFVILGTGFGLAITVLVGEFFLKKIDINGRL